MAMKRDEHRKAPRRAVVGHALIRGPDLRAPCTIRDLSATGAKIQVRSSTRLPREFNLMLLKANTSRHAVLKWRAGNFAGVAFSCVEAISSPATETPLVNESKPAPDPGQSPQRPSGTIEGEPAVRIAPRRRVLGHCLIVAPGIHASGVIRDVSATGARLGVAAGVELPEEFQIVDPKTNSARQVSLRWRRGDLAGVQFCAPMPTKASEVATITDPSSGNDRRSLSAC